LARGLGIPAVVGCGAELVKIAAGTELVLDGTAGEVLVSPTQQVLKQYRAKSSALEASLTEANAQRHQPAITQDGRQLEVVANIGGLSAARSAVESGAEGVGLLRTEFLYLERQSLPDEEEQTRAYQAILDVFEQKPVVLRTLDIGGDKAIPYLGLPQESNPFLGVRGLRLCLRRSDLFKPQLRAALRASVGHNLKIMFPMVAAVDEVRRARDALNECRDELLREGKPVAEKIEVGIMVEVPSAAILAAEFASLVDFFSIGTNDLTQYTLAADRTNPELAGLANAFSPAVLRLIDQVIQAAHNARKWVGVCGELAGEPLALPILLGLGLDEFSMNPPAIPLAKQVLRRLNARACQDLAREALTESCAQDVKDLVVGSFPWVVQ
jgi:phosphoenolpyruvate-protein phosphotransferase